MAKLLQPRKGALSLDLRNSDLSLNAVLHLSNSLSNGNFYLTALSLKFCYLEFDHLLSLGEGIKYNHTLVKLDLSSNGLKPCTLKFFLESIVDNTSLADLNLAGNFLDNEFAVDLAHLLEFNQTLHTVDISRNPIGPEGAKYLLQSLLQHNDTLESLGDDLESNVYMGVRVRVELK